jgi:hypothetical protein
MKPGAPHLDFEMWDSDTWHHALFAGPAVFSVRAEGMSTTGS